MNLSQVGGDREVEKWKCDSRENSIELQTQPKEKKKLLFAHKPNRFDDLKEINLTTTTTGGGAINFRLLLRWWTRKIKKMFTDEPLDDIRFRFYEDKLFKLNFWLYRTIAVSGEWWVGDIRKFVKKLNTFESNLAK